MELSARRRPTLDRYTIKKRNYKLIFVATEGRRTEDEYLQFFSEPRVYVIPIPNEENKSAPEYILSNLDGFKESDDQKKQWDFQDIDEFWIMIDTDHWIEPNHIHNFSSVIQSANQKEYGVAVSNPGIELWLYLHLSDLTHEDLGQNRAKYFEQKIKDLLGGFNKNCPNKEDFISGVQDAIRRAKVLDSNPSERWPKNTGSHVYHLVESIFEGI